MTETEKKATRKIPAFNSLEEEATFWDTHDTADYEDEFKPVKARFAKNLSQPLSVRLPDETLAILKERAKKKGVGAATYARMLILERLHDDEH